LNAAWTVAKNAAAQEGGPLFVSEPSTAEDLGKLAAQINALARVIDNARKHGFIAKTVEETAPLVLAPPITPGTQASSNALTLVQLPKPQPTKGPTETRALVLHGHSTMLQAAKSERLAIIVCPNCQMKVVST
jgi:hypothetical protein